MSILTQRLLRQGVVAMLNNAAIAQSVQSPGDWPTAPGDLPAILVRVPRAIKQGLSRGQATFTTLVTVEIEARVSGATGEAAQDDIEALAFSIEDTLLRDWWLNRLIQQFVSFDCQTAITAEGGPHFGGMRMSVVMETFESYLYGDPESDPDAWSLPPETVPLEGMNIHLDMAAPYSPTGTFPDPAFPDSVQPDPRTSGPDGRDEGALQIDLPQ